MRNFIAVLFFCGFSGLNGQSLSLDLQAYPNLTKLYQPSIIIPYGGIGLSFGYYAKKQKLSTGINFRSSNWGNELSVKQSIVFNIVNGQKYVLNQSNTGHFFIPLYHNKLSGGLALASALHFHIASRPRIYFSWGLRYNYYPNYVGKAKSSYLESSLGIHIVLKK